MNIFDVAMKLEREGEEFYKQLIRMSWGKEGTVFILNMLANDEVKHYRTFRQMSENETPVWLDSTVVEEALAIFRKIEDYPDWVDEERSQRDLYTRALELEENTIEVYTEMLGKLSEPKQMEIVQKIISEEKKHRRVLENIIELLDNPKHWVENAEFNHLEDEVF